MIERLGQTDLPAVAIASARAAPNGWAITINDRSAAHTMGRHLVSLGHRSIGFIAGNPNQNASAQRLAGYQDGLAEADLPAEQTLIAPGFFSYRSGLDAADRLLDLQPPPTAILASNDDMAAAVVASAHRRDLRFRLTSVSAASMTRNSQRQSGLNLQQFTSRLRTWLARGSNC